VRTSIAFPFSFSAIDSAGGFKDEFSFLAATTLLFLSLDDFTNFEDEPFFLAATILLFLLRDDFTNFEDEPFFLAAAILFFSPADFFFSPNCSFDGCNGNGELSLSFQVFLSVGMLKNFVLVSPVALPLKDSNAKTAAQ
jgi:hypothetical protein